LGIKSTNILTYFSPGSHSFYNTTTSTTNPTFNIDSTGNVTTLGNIDCGGGIAITSSNASYVVGGVIDSTSLITNTFITFKEAGTGSDWCYLRQIGVTNDYKLSFDFYDDISNTKFCLRNIQSTVNPDIITEVFTVDNGNLTTLGNITCSGSIYPTGKIFATNGNAIATPATSTSGGTGDRIILYNGGAASEYPYSIGIAATTLWYSTAASASHRFYIGGTAYVNIDSTGLTCTGDVSGFGSISDKRLKTNINKLHNSLDLINKLNPVNFTWKNDEDIIEEKRNTNDVGFIAQEIKEILPFTTGKYKSLHSEKEFHNIKYERIIPYLVKSIQELTEKNNILENKLNYIYKILNIDN
jgi:hypothetical protein